MHSWNRLDSKASTRPYSSSSAHCSASREECSPLAHPTTLPSLPIPTVLHLIRLLPTVIAMCVRCPKNSGRSIWSPRSVSYELWGTNSETTTARTLTLPSWPKGCPLLGRLLVSSSREYWAITWAGVSL